MVQNSLLSLMFFFSRCRFKLIEEENSPPSDLQQYLKDNKRQLWRPKEPTKEIERGIWNENYLKKLHETLKVTIFSENFPFLIPSRTTAISSEEIHEAQTAQVYDL